MKEYIYLDNELVNSYLAQLDEGILTKMITGFSETDSSKEDGGNEITKETTGGASFYFAKGEHSFSKKEIDKFSSVYSKNNSELIETALNDYSLDVLLTKLNEENRIKTEDENWGDGDIISISGETDFFNFKRLKESSQEDNLRHIIKKSHNLMELENEHEQLTRKHNRNKAENVRLQTIKNKIKTITKDEGMENFKNIENFGSYMDILFPNSVLTKTSNVISLCDVDNLRVNLSALSLYALSKRKFKIFGIVISQHVKSNVPQKGEQLPSKQISATATTIFMDIMLTSFDLLHLGDYFIRPIAIYYEKE